MKREHTFSARLEQFLNAGGIPAEVINAGVPGYTPCNELEFYRSKGPAFAAEQMARFFAGPPELR